MRLDSALRLAAVPFIAAVALAVAAQNFSGEYADKQFLKGAAVFQMSLEATGNDVSVWFSAAYTDGHGAAPEAEGKGHISNAGRLEFSFTDSFGNSGTGTATRAGDALLVALKPSRVADSRCLQFYQQSIRLTPQSAAKKRK